MNLLSDFVYKYKNHISNIVIALFFLLPIVGVIYFFIDIKVFIVLIAIFMSSTLYLKKNTNKWNTGLTQRGWDRAILTVINLLLYFCVILSLFLDNQYTVVFLILALFSYLQVSNIPKYDLEVGKILEELKHDTDLNHQIIEEDILKSVDGIGTRMKKTKKDTFDIDRANIAIDVWADSDTKLQWQVKVPGKLMSWYEALEYANNLNKENHLGINTWRVPTIEELFTIHQDKPQLNHNYKDELKVYTHIALPLLNSMVNETQNYWSSTEFEHNDLEDGINFASYVEFDSIGGNNFRKDYKCCVRCVSEYEVKQPIKKLEIR